MNTPLKFDTETIMAFVDGELDASQAAAMEQAMQNDARLAAQVQQQRELTTRLRKSFDAQLAEPMNEHLLNTLRAAKPSVDQDHRVVDLTQARQHKHATSNRWQTREWSALAASLIVGILIGMYALHFNGDALLATRNGQLLAQGQLATALHTQLASAPTADHAIKIGISFRNQAGQYCRSFTLQDRKSLAGVACHADKDWRIQLLTEASTDGANEFRQANTSTPDAVLALIDKQIQGEPLDAEAETRAIHDGW